LDASLSTHLAAQTIDNVPDVKSSPQATPLVEIAEDAELFHTPDGNENWAVVEITSTGWRVIADSPVRFRRARGMLALPYPVAGGTISDLRPFVNVGADAADANKQAHSKDNDFILLCAWLVQALRPTGPYSVGVLHGEQGSTKSTTQRVLRSLAEGGLGFEPGAFLLAYTENRGSANELVLETSAVAPVLIAFIQEEQAWHDAATELLEALNRRVSEKTQKQREWPKNGSVLSNKLRRLDYDAGVNVTNWGERDGQWFALSDMGCGMPASEIEFVDEEIH
jgi:hypothetical protein